MVSEFLFRLGQASLSGTIAVAMIYLSCRLLPRLSGNVRCWLWWLVSAKLLLGLAPLPAIPLGLLPSVPPVAVFKQVPHGETNATESVITPVPSPLIGPERAASSPLSFADLLLGAWLVGVGVGIGGQAMALLQLRRLIAGVERFETPLMAQAALRAGFSRVPVLFASPTPIEPLTIGIVRPVVVIGKSDLSRLSEGELLPILTHECIHIRHGDLWLALAPSLAQILFWFLPPVYLAAREYELSREAACDQQTIAALALTPCVYGELLIKLSSPLSPLPTPSSVMALSANFQQMKRRIEMLQIKPSRRRFLALLTLPAVAVLLPYQLTAAPLNAFNAPPSDDGSLPNLNLSAGLQNWKKMANGSDDMPAHYYAVGLDPAVTHEGRPSAFVTSTAVSPARNEGDGGVLRYDWEKMNRFQGKRVRLSAYVLGKDLTKQAFLFLAADTADKSYFAVSPKVTSQAQGWQKCECVFDMPKDAEYLSLGLRLEGEGTAYGSGFQLEVVDKSVPLSEVKENDTMTPPENLDFKKGLEGWGNDNPQHNANEEYLLGAAEHGGRDGRPAAFLKTKVAKPTGYGTIMQNASPKQYLGKRIRFSAYLKGADAGQGELWMVLHDAKPGNSDAWNAQSTGKIISGTTKWTKIEHIIDIPTTTKALSFGISSEGTGTVWVDGFTFEILGPAQRKK